ncbi:protein LONGIFOLIA 1-like [Camelina sativa]|uniref:Longifolia 1 n=1 Tax=Camelina sativa TaxID=90675 RepID=A0A068GNJ7_CAMSA|nr:protein LONGIFOLIA 1-like [Camelina sativa]AID81892.1 longifolia 1 [Camelina sativa]
MSAKLLYNLSDENPNLNKQIGCMNGIFQVFYRQHYPPRRVAVTGDELKSLPSGKTSDNVGDINISTDNKETEKSKKKKAAAKEKHKGVSSESSSRLSFSSSPCSSSFSSADISTTASQFEQPCLIQTNNGENSAREPTYGSPRWGGLVMPSDLRELVRSSIHKETRSRDEEALSQQPKSARANVSLLKESSPSRNSNEWSEGRRVVKLKDSPRFSYDERETRKTVPKLKETPRLSLDSRSNSFRSAKSSCSPEPQEVVTGHRRTTSSVVAKLMGLEVIPDEPVVAVQDRENRFCDSPRPTSRVDIDLQRSRSSDSIKTMMPAKFPMKVAPWTQVDGAKNQVKAADATTLTVYGEIQKRLSQLEFKKSEKDLRALQQILEAMEKTQHLISKDDDNKTNFMQGTDQPVPSATSPSSKNFKASSIVVMKVAAAPVFKETGISGSASFAPRNVALANVKVGNLRQTQNVIPRKQSAMDVTPRPGFYKGQTDSTMKSASTRPLQSKNDMAKSGKIQKPSVSPRTPPKKLGFEKQSRPTSPKPEPNKTQRQQLSRQQIESASPRRKQGIKSRGLHQSEDRLSDESSDLRSQRSDSNVSLASNLDTEVTSRYNFERNSDIIEQHTPKQKSPELGMRSLPKPLKVTVEQPSPVSVLDVAFDEDDSPSPVRKISIFKEDDNLSSEESQWMNKHSSLCRSIVWPESNASLKQPDAELIEGFMEEDAEFKNGDHKYAAEILSAAGLLRDIDYSMISIQLHQAHLPINPNLFFVLEQNKTSNVSLQDNKHKGRGFGQQQTANLIERSKRKLVFDTINEILARRFAADGCTKQPSIISSISPLRITEKNSRGKELLQTLCSEIDRLQQNSKCILDEDDEDLIWEDLQSHGMNWKEIEGETPGLVLDIERLIFKDLISEVVTSEVAAFPGMLSGQPRQLFHC